MGEDSSEMGSVTWEEKNKTDEETGVSATLIPDSRGEEESNQPTYLSHFRLLQIVY